MWKKKVLNSSHLILNSDMCIERSNLLIIFAVAFFLTKARTSGYLLIAKDLLETRIQILEFDNSHPEMSHLEGFSLPKKI